MKEWIKQSLDRGADFLSGQLVHQKAEEFAKKLDVQSSWKGSEGWFSRFKKREGLVHKKLHGEAKDADVQQRENWIVSVWPSLWKQYDKENIFNADETGIYFCAMPDSMLTFQNHTRCSTKKSKERITCLMICSMVGEKKKLLIVGKSKTPRCFKMDGGLLMKAAWEEVDAVTIRNCWVKAGLKMGPHEKPAYTSQMIVPSELPINQKQWEDFITTDDDLEVGHVLDEDEIVDIVQACHEEEKMTKKMKMRNLFQRLQRPVML